MDDQNLSGQAQDGLASEVMESLGESNDATKEEAPSSADEGGETLPNGVKDRLWRQERKHQREMRNMRAQLENLQSQMSQNQTSNTETNPYSGSDAGVDEQIHKAVSYALQHKEAEERKAKEAERMQHVHKQYQELHKHLDDTADKYEDFEDTVRGPHAPFTPHMRDAALLLPRKGAGSAGEVLYKLGKNPSELDRISKLHPLDQAAEVVALSHALINGEDTKTSTPRPLGQIKSNPVTNTHAVTDKTPVSDLRKRMKGWKGH